MFWTLTKVRLSALFNAMFRQNARKKKTSPIVKILIGLLSVYVIGCFFLMFGGLFSFICGPFHELGIDWFYFALMAMVSFALMFIGSVFITQTQLYEAKDNALLLAMPLRPRDILASRMFVLLLYNFVFELFVALPAAVIYAYNFGVSARWLLPFILVCFALPFLALTISCIIGWLLWLLTSRVRNKSLMTTVFSLAFLAAYFLIYSRRQTIINSLIAYGKTIADNVRGAVAPIYWLGSAIGDGNVAYLAITIAIIAALFALVYFWLSVTFIRTATTVRGFARIKYRERALKVASPRRALLRREFNHFLASPVYMMNSALGVVFILVAAVYLAVKSDYVIGLVTQIPFLADYLPLFAAAALCAVASLDAISAPSVSLEGKSLWICRSLPVSSLDIITAKLKMHIYISLPPTLVLTAVCVAVLRPSLADSLLLVITPVLFNVATGLLGLVFALLFPKFNWTNEAAVVKQSAAVGLTMIGSMAMVFIPGLLYGLLLVRFMSSSCFMLICCALFALLCVVFWLWIRKNGVRRFEAL